MSSDISLAGKIVNPNLFKLPSKAVSFTKSIRFRKAIQETPGPGYYIHTPTPSQSITFSKTKRDSFIPPSDTPGPGLYNPSKQSKSPSFSIQTSERRSVSPLNPGPGDYENRILSRPKSVIFPRTKRVLLKYESEVPGPGHYTSRPLQRSSSSTFSKAPRGFNSELNPLGPGSYNLQSRRVYKFAISTQRRKSPF